MKTVLSGLVVALTVVAPPAARAQQAIPAPNAKATPRPASDFAALPFIVGPQLSPKGTHVAAKLSVSGQQVFGVMSLFDKTKPVVVGLGENDLLSWSWANDEWLAVRIGSVVNVQGSDWYVTRVLGVNATTGKLAPIGFSQKGQSANILWVANDGTPRIAISAQKSIYNDGKFFPDVDEVDLSTGKSRTLVPGRSDVWDWYIDPTGVVRIGIGYNDTTRTARLLYRPDASSSFRVVDRADQRKEQTLKLPILLAGGGDKALTYSRKDGFYALYEMTLTM
jgi:hypothetical protein